MDYEAVKRALDRAIASVANEEFHRLSSGMSLSDKANKVEWALKELRKLQSGRIPEYSDEWVALFYLTWYQASQINLVYSVIKEMGNNGVAISDNLHIVDFGCGSLAMQFGVAFAAADVIEEGNSIRRIEIELIDDSAPMIRLGHEVWKQFKRELSPGAESYPILAGYQAIAFRTTTTEEVARRNWSNSCWVSAVHAVYEENKGCVSEELRVLVNALNPDVCYTTTNDMNGQGQKLLSTVWSAVDNSHNVFPLNSKPMSQFNGGLMSVTEWRRNLYDNLLNAPTAEKIFNYLTRAFDYPIRDYLTNQVSWQWRDAATLVYIKRE